MTKRLRVLLDANPMVLRTGASHLPGIGRTTLELALALDQINDPAVSIGLLTQTFRGRVPASFQHFKTTNLPWPIGPRYDWLKRRLPLLNVCAPHDLLHIPGNFDHVYRPQDTVATIHDAMFFSFPEEFLGHDFSRRHVPAFARACRAIAAPSASSKADIVNFMNIPPERVFVIPWGVDRKIFHPLDKENARQQVADQTPVKRPYFISVSCDIGRKNTIAVLNAFRMALRQGFEHDLVLVWGRPPEAYLQEFASEIKAGRIHFLKHLPDSLLGALYAGATASFFPSRYEGFGLPVLESMACGTPVVTCRNSSLAEVGGAAAVYIDPDRPEEMCDLMRLWDGGGSPGLPHEAEACLAQAALFTWEKAAQRYLSFYKQHATSERAR